MKQKDREACLMEAAMEIIAKNGMNSFAMKQVTTKAGVSEALIYKYFGTKEKLLKKCYDTVNQQIGSLFEDMQVTMLQSQPGVHGLAHEMWMRYIQFLVKNDFRTLFYFEYRTAFEREVREDGDEAAKTYFKKFVFIFQQFDQMYHVFQRMNNQLFWTYILDGTGLFARRFICQNIPATAENFELAWKLIWGGIGGLI
ncbi:MAG: helix-turn-helix domain containing protein [Lachnospiraceae bacterium]|nr:helix-turn-helix domain containing protein [Lachnospiraceae bacterium]MDD3796051.1 helix-turn-helix domain containing protein [Lachnospiraceae bacterium]